MLTTENNGKCDIDKIKEPFITNQYKKDTSWFKKKHKKQKLTCLDIIFDKLIENRVYDEHFKWSQ
jgi:hypothetical protein